MFTRFTALVFTALFATCLVASNAQELIREPGTTPAAQATSTARDFELKPGPVAPAGAAGSAQLKPGKLSLHLTHLGPGTYVVEALTHSGDVPYRLGVIEITDPTNSPGREANDNKREASAHPESVHLDTDVTMTLPPELSSLQFSRLRVLDPGRNAVLEGSAK